MIIPTKNAIEGILGLLLSSVCTDDRSSYIVIKITKDSDGKRRESPDAIELTEWRTDGLKYPSWALTNKELLVSGSTQVGVYGHMSQEEFGDIMDHQRNIRSKDRVLLTY